ncbi:MAG: hypothetical protein HYV97_15720 [Bdellovibrio sp.]|nr:hypothetical protein [Bdellovibrio sp.]
MKKIVGLLLIIVGFVGWKLIPTFDYRTSETSQPDISNIQTPAVSAVTQSPDTIAVMSQAEEISNDQDEIKREYQDVAYSLAQKIKQNNLDVTLLNEWVSKLSRTEFLQKLPEEVREGYENLEKVILKIRNNHLKEDGMTESFFTKYKVEMPLWLLERREKLNAYPLPEDVASLVLKKTSDAEISNEDVDKILRGCGKKNNNCIDKAFALLIDANHALDDSQLKRIQEFL